MTKRTTKRKGSNSKGTNYYSQLKLQTVLNRLVSNKEAAFIGNLYEKTGNTLAEAVIANYVHYLRDKHDEEVQKQLVSAYRLYAKVRDRKELSLFDVHQVISH